MQARNQQQEANHIIARLIEHAKKSEHDELTKLVYETISKSYLPNVNPYPYSRNEEKLILNAEDSLHYKNDLGDYLNMCAVLLYLYSKKSEYAMKEKLLGEQMLMLDPYQVYASLLTAELYVDQGKFKEASLLASKFLSLQQPPSSNYEKELCLRAKLVPITIAKAKRDVEAILRHCQEVVELSYLPSYGDVTTSKFAVYFAWAHLQKNNLDSALQWANKGVFFLEEAYLILTEVFFLQNNPKNTQEYAELYIKQIKSTNQKTDHQGDYLKVLGILLSTIERDNAKKIQIAEEIISLNASHIDANLFFAEHYATIENKDPHAAITHAKKALQSITDAAEQTLFTQKKIRAQIVLARCYKDLGDVILAVYYANAVLEKDASYKSDVQAILVWEAWVARKYQQVLELAKEFYSRSSADHAVVADAYFRTHQPLAAIEYVRNFFASQPEKGPLYTRMCHLLIESHVQQLTLQLQKNNEVETRKLAQIFINPATDFSQQLSFFYRQTEASNKLQNQPMQYSPK